jgi:phosphoglycerate dehydrogenase-like enzyme
MYDPFLTTDQARELGVEKVELMDLMTRSEIVSLHAPNLPATRHMLTAAHFKAMKDQAIFINTARGAIVDQEALTIELATGRIFAYLDVTDPEPPAPDHPLRSMPNVVLTPHIAGAISNGCHRLGRQAVDAVLAFQQGKPLPGQVTEAMAAQMA